MTDEMITIPRKLAEDLLAVLARKFDDAEGGVPPETSWSMEDTVVSRALAEAVGGDPAAYVATKHRGVFPHAFDAGTHFDFWRWDTPDGNWKPGAEKETHAQVIRRLGRFPYEACAELADGTRCAKAANDPIHQATEMGA